jgi:hypothetical protein
MELFKLRYSAKDIPIPSHREYLKRLLEKVESVIKRMRWKAFFFLNPVSKADESDGKIQHEKFGFKSKKTPPQIDEIINFERELLGMVENIQFRDVSDSFQSMIKEDVRKINSSEKLYVPADKTRNMYTMDHTNYDKLLTENITQKYKAANPSTVKDIDTEFDIIAENLDISDRINKTAEKHAFITLKDHKDNFEHNTKCRLINPAKSELGKVSKCMLDRINKVIRLQTNTNQWRSTSSVLEWFNRLPEKKKLTFLVFDIVDFYPSISEDLLAKSLSWAKQYTNITDNEYATIMHVRKSLLFCNKGEPWVKKDTPNAFDVTMGAYDGAEVCELVGLFVLQDLQSKLKAFSVGLYRDDGLAVFKGFSGSKADQARKRLIKLFKAIGLNITVQTNLKSVNYLDVNFNLDTGKHQPYRKPNDQPIYIHTKSNHPPSIIKQIPITIGKRISELSSTQDIFTEAASTYNEALKNSGYNEAIQYTINTESSENQAKKKRNRTRNITWFNPPYSKNVKTNVGGTFIKLIAKHFPPGHKLQKMFNNNTVKISYSCMKIIKSIITSHNSQIIKKETKETSRTCNCRTKDSCPLGGKCLASAIVYKATVISPGSDTKSYVGLSGGEFKLRYNNHTKSFRHEKYEKETELSKHIWDMKRNGRDYTIIWDIVTQSNTHRRDSGQCNLCIDEKLEILKMKGNDTLNKKSELISMCRHCRRAPDRAKK